MEESSAELNESPIGLGSKVIYQGEVGTVVCIVPAHQWPHTYDTSIEAGIRKYVIGAKQNLPQQCRTSAYLWKKRREDMYIICYPPNGNWICTVRRAPLNELEPTPIPVKGVKSVK